MTIEHVFCLSVSLSVILSVPHLPLSLSVSLFSLFFLFSFYYSLCSLSLYYSYWPLPIPLKYLCKGCILPSDHCLLPIHLINVYMRMYCNHWPLPILLMYLYMGIYDIHWQLPITHPFNKLIQGIILATDHWQSLPTIII